ncbi:MAG: Ig-like domain-containing protein, partial [Solirubrobacteraceae bacterium]
DRDPVAVNDSATVAQGAAATAVDVLANDTDADGGPKQVASVTQPKNGAVAVTGGGTGVSYKANAGYCNSQPGGVGDTFTYALNGGSTATVAMTVTCAASPPGPGGNPPGPPGQGTPAPRVTAVTAAAPIVSGRPALLSAQVAGSAQRLDWDVTGDGKTDVSCAGDRTTLRFRPPAAAGARAARFTGQVSVRPIGAGGAGPSFSQTLAVAPAPAISGARVAKRISAVIARAPPVYACGKASDLPAAKGELTIKADLSDRFCLPRTISAGTLRVEGCLKPIRTLGDLPRAEQELVKDLWRPLSFTGGGRGKTEVKAVTATALSLSDSYVANGSVFVNGVEVDPRGGARIVVYSQVNKIVSPDAAMSVGDIDLKLPSEDYFSLDTKPASGGKIPVGDFPRLPTSTLKGLAGFPLTGGVGVVLEPDSGATITLDFKLPEVFSLLGGDPPTAKAVVRATNERGLILDSLSISLPQANLGALRLKKLKFDYLRQDPSCGGRSSWRGGGDLLFGPTGDAGLKFSPPPTERGIAFCGSRFSAGGQFMFGLPGPPEPQIYPGVFLKSIGLGIGLNPTVFRGDAHISVAQITDVFGTLLAVFASPEEPYTLSDDDAGATLAKLPRKTFTETTFAVGGSVSIDQPLLGKIDLGSAYFLYAYPDYVALGGTSRLEIPGGSVTGSFDGELGIRRRAFNFRVSGETCTILCYGADVLVSSAGVAGCGEVKVKIPPFKNPLGQIEVTWRPGIGWRYGDFPPTIYLNGCDVAPFRAQVAAAAADGSRTFTIRRGVPHELIRLMGQNGAPSVEVRGPGGETVSTALADIDGKGSIRILRSRATRATFIDGSKPGDYTVTPLDGSPPIGSMSTAEGLPPASVKAKVGGSGERRTLAYDVAPRAGQKVTFVEKGPTTNQVLGSVTSGKGTLRFKAGTGQSGARQIVARIELGGLARKEPVVARYKVGPPPKPGRPGRPKVRRKGTALTVSWSAAKGATSYGVVVTTPDGLQKAVRVTAKRRSTRVTGIPATQGGTVTVDALTVAGDAGPTASARFAATKKTRSRFRPISKRGRK